ncbi:MAG: alpha/beta hydrolase-fold protein [Acidobacteriota bacterium]|nr:alpha/beta hydrolase-fold protein [Acidobacteriota bacterium]
MGSYRTIELSDPQFEHDHLRLLTFKSPALAGRGDVTIFVPPGCEEREALPLILLLHGVYCSHWAWSLKGGAHLTALKLIGQNLIGPVVIAMPSDGLWGDGTGYVPHQSADYERWIMEDVVGCVTEVLPCLGAQSELFIAGLSMGGYGALRLGARYARRVSGISGHSSLTHSDQLARFVEEPVAAGEASRGEDMHVLYWMKENKEILPPLRFDCGTSDDLIEENRKLHRALIAHDISHQYFEFEGDHSWPYWREHIKDTLLFFAGQHGK